MPPRGDARRSTGARPSAAVSRALQRGQRQTMRAGGRSPADRRPLIPRGGIPSPVQFALARFLVRLATLSLEAGEMRDGLTWGTTHIRVLRV